LSSSSCKRNCNTFLLFRNILSSIIVVTFLLLSSWTVQAITAEKLLSRLKANQEKIQDLEAELEITTEIPGMQTPMKQKGHIWYKAPDRIRIDIQEPMQQTTIIVGSTMTVKIGDRVSAMNLHEMAGMPNAGIMATPDTEQWMKDYDITMTGTPEQGVYTLRLIPKQTNNLWKQMEIDVDSNRGIQLQSRIYGSVWVQPTVIRYEGYKQSSNGGWYATLVMSEQSSYQGAVRSKTTYANVRVNMGEVDDVFSN